MKESALQGKALILQSGGPTRVINRSLYGIVTELSAYIEREGSTGRTPLIDGIYGSLHGVRGILDEEFIDLDRVENLYKIAQIPSSALGTTRYELVEKTDEGIRVREDDLNRTVKVLKAHNIAYIFAIGGGDSSETVQVLSQGAKDRNYNICVMHVPKTIDNDLVLTDHCPGYGSAATYIVNALIGKWYDARAMGKTIDLNVIMGRNAGWLTASARWCNRRGYEPFIVAPENPMEIEEFTDAVAKRYKENDRLLQIAASEGARGSRGEWAKQLAAEIGFEARRDVTGRTILSDIPLANLLAPKIKEATGARIVADTLGYAQRSFLGVWSEVDGNEAEEVGRQAVRRVLEGEPGKMISIQRDSALPYKVSYKPIELLDVAKPGEKIIRPVPREYFDDEGQPSDAFVSWLEPLLGEIPETEILKGAPVEKLVFD